MTIASGFGMQLLRYRQARKSFSYCIDRRSKWVKERWKTCAHQLENVLKCGKCKRVRDNISNCRHNLHIAHIHRQPVLVQQDSCLLVLT